MGSAGAIVVILVLFSIIIIFIKVRSRQLKDRNTLVDDIPEQGEVLAHNFNGQMVYLSESDLQAWKNLNNAQRQSAQLQQRNLLKSGQLVKVVDGEKIMGLISRAEAIEKGIIK